MHGWGGARLQAAAGKTKQRSRRSDSQSGVPGFGRNTPGTVAFRVEASWSMTRSTSYWLPTKRARLTRPRAGTPSLSVGSGPRPVRSKSMRRCWGRMTTSTPVRSPSPGAGNGPKGVSTAPSGHHPLDDVDVREEHRRLLVDGRIVERVGRSLLNDPAGAHQRDAIGHPHRLLGLVGHQQHRRPLLLEDVEGFVADAVAQPVVEAREGLVHEQDRRPRRQRPGKRHPLLLAARELVRIALGVTGEADAREAPAPARPARRRAR